MKEEWRDIPGYEGLYQVSDMGNVKSLNYRRSGKSGLLSPRSIGQGYLSVELFKNGVSQKMRVHRLVLLAFVGPSPLPVDHKDWNITNNRLDNLRYCTASENNSHKRPYQKMKVVNGKKAVQAKLNADQVTTIKKLLRDGERKTDIAKKFDVSFTCIWHIAVGKNWSWVE